VCFAASGRSSIGQVSYSYIRHFKTTDLILVLLAEVFAIATLKCGAIKEVLFLAIVLKCSVHIHPSVIFPSISKRIFSLKRGRESNIILSPFFREEHRHGI
jgi:hypothetical protein